MHFTYQKPNFDTLNQGDILEKTPELAQLLEEVHPHYTNKKYTYFQVVTQSCDLSLRGNPLRCSSRYITLTAVRSLNDIILREIENIASRKVLLNDNYCCSDEHKRRIEDFLKKLFNNNHKNYFFLKKCPEYNLHEDSCTILHLSISVRAYEHYEKCLKAKRIELTENFRAKLGWSVGNLYSRVGTEDYVPGLIKDQKTFDKFISETLDGYIAWVPAKLFSHFKKVSAEESDFDVIDSRIKKIISRKDEKKLNQVISIIKKSVELNQEEEQTMRNLFSQDTLMKKIFT